MAMNQDDDTVDISSSDKLNGQERNPLEILAAEFSDAQRSGDCPSIDVFIERVPEQREEARALLQSIALFERVADQERAKRSAASRISHSNTEALQHLGDFRIIREVGRGGMGIIYEAEQLSLKRRVALKVLGPGIAKSAKQLERFHRESEAIARLHHTNIVPVFGSGVQDEVHYFAMQLIDGRPLSEPFDLSYSEVGKLGLQAASALAYAHGHGVLHRDIKPSNLLLDKSGELWVTDFGLAKLSDVGDLTQTGDVMGTLKYMAPEQLEGRSDERTDVYSLGLTLYELVTHQPAFDISKSLANRIRNHEFPAPRTVNPLIPRDLETIILKATAREAQHRYASASALAEDLRRFTEDRPIEARRVSSMERLGRWIRRNPALAASLAATLLLLMATTIVTSIGFVTTRSALGEAKLARDNAFLSSKRADSAREDAESNQRRAEKNLSVALQAFDAIFDNVASRGVPQALTLDISQSQAQEGDQTAEAGHDSSQAPRFESTLTTADANLLNSLLSFYREFADQNNDDSVLRVRTALAYHRIGQIQVRLGSSDEAIKSYDESLKSLVELDKLHPGTETYVVAIAEILNDRGLALSTSARPVPEIVSSHKLAERFLSDQPIEIQQAPRVRFELARSYDLAGSVLARGGALSLPNDAPDPRGPIPGVGRMIESLFRGAPFRNGPQHDGPPHDGPRRDGPQFGFEDRQAAGRGGPGGMRMLQSLIDNDLFRARTILEELCNEFSERSDYQLAFAQVQRHLMMHFMATGRMAEAQEAFERARQTLGKLMQTEPNQPKTMIELAETLSSASVRLKSLDDPASQEYLRQAIATCQQLCEAFPSVPEYQALLANSQDKLGLLESKRESWANADRAFLQAAERLFELLARFPEHRFYQLSALMAANHLAETRLQLAHQSGSDPKQVEDSLAEAGQLLEKAIAFYDRPNMLDPFSFRNVGEAIATLARLQHAQGDFQSEQRTLARLRQRPEPPRLRPPSRDLPVEDSGGRASKTGRSQAEPGNEAKPGSEANEPK